MRKYTFVLVTFILLFSGPAFGQWDNQGGKADDTAYGVSWDGSKKAATQNALYDIISALGGGHDAITLDANAQNLLTLTDQALGIHTQVANRVYAGPTTGADAVPTFRALVAEDIPTLNQNTTGTAAGLTDQYIDWDAVSGGASIANKPTLLALGELSTNAYQGDRGKIAYDHSQAAHAPAIDWTTDQGATNIHAGNVDTIGALITGYSSGAGTVAATDTLLQAINKLNGNIDLKLNIADSPMTGDATLTDATPTFICNDSDNAAGTCGFFANSSGGANDIIWSFGVEDSTGASTEYFQIDGVTETIDFLKPVTLASGWSITGTTSGGQYMFLREDTDNTADNYSGWGIYGELAHSTIYALPLAAPAAGQVMSFAAPGNQTMSDGSTQSVSVGTNVYKDQSQTPVIDDPDNFAANFTGANLYGGTFIANAAGTAVLPNATEGMNFTYILEGANANIIDPLGTGTADTIYMNGLAATADKNITSSTSGAMCVFQYRAANTWMATCNGWVEATPP